MLLSDLYSSTYIKTILDTECLSIIYNPNLKLCKVIYKKKMNTHEYKLVIELLIEFTKEHNVNYYLFDISNKRPNLIRVIKWINNIKFTEIKNDKISKVGIVLGNCNMRTYYMNLLIGILNKNNFPIKFFKMEGHSVRWFLK